MSVRVSEIVSLEDRQLAYDIRRIVFCDEQGVSREEEFDGLDDISRHYLVSVDALGVGTARTRVLEAGEIKIERVAVLRAYRGLGLGSALMRRVMEEAGTAPMVLNAQFRTKSFYKALGFSAVGDIFDEAGIEHVRMIRNR
tara:strand:- start:103 stop:525 length:423 start_codon:yes stop_codon:yes gene_type:complete